LGAVLEARGRWQEDRKRRAARRQEPAESA
jgi:hypothetical protein